jgi:hypothetical protein
MTQPPPIPVTQKRKSTLATLSLVFSCCSILTPLFLGTIAGIICGHMAIKEFKRDPELEGRQKAKWGLIIGYASIVFFPLLGFGVLYMFGGICGGGLLKH